MTTTDSFIRLLENINIYECIKRVEYDPDLFYKIYDQLPFSAEMYLSLPVFTLDEFKKLQAKVKKYLLGVGGIGKFRLNIEPIEKAMIALTLKNGDILFFIKLDAIHSHVIYNDKMYVCFNDDNILYKALHYLYNNLSTIDDIKRTPLLTLIQKCNASNLSITNPVL